MNAILLGLDAPAPDTGEFVVGVNNFNDPIVLSVLCLSRSNLARDKPAHAQLRIKLRDRRHKLLL